MDCFLLRTKSPRSTEELTPSCHLTLGSQLREKYKIRVMLNMYRSQYRDYISPSHLEHHPLTELGMNEVMGNFLNVLNKILYMLNFF